MKNLAIEKCLRKLAAENGGHLQPDLVVEAAKDPKSPLHKRFEWDDGEAAHQYRLWQARHLISVCVEVLGKELEPSPVFVSVSTDRKEGRGYRVMTTVLSDSQLREQLLRDALMELNTFQQKYQQLTQLAGIFAEIKKVRRKAA